MQIAREGPGKDASAPDRRLLQLAASRAPVLLLPSLGQTQPLEICGDSGSKVVAGGRNSIFHKAAVFNVGFAPDSW